ncbi:MAG: prepilin-type N-terminal cleavage/methylation domain-containing protein [Candidatus Omnitrophota bacterium]
MLNKKDGFTLLELLIASGVLIIALTGLLATYAACYDLAETTRNSNLALNAAQETLEEMRNINFLSVFSLYDGATFQVSGMPANSSLGYVVVNNSNSSLLNVAIGVCWRQKGSRIIGECVDSSGALVFSDTNADGRLNSPVELVTYMAQR